MSKDPKSKIKNTTQDQEYVEITVSPFALIVFVLLIGVLIFFSKKAVSQEPKSTNGAQTQAQTQETNKVKVGDIDTFEVAAKIGDSPVLGNQSAPVTIFEFSDFECPFCRAFYYGIPNSDRIKPAWPEIKKQYIDTGKVKYVSKSFVAVPSHNPAAKYEAQAAYCAGQQGKYFDYMHKLFEKAGKGGAGAEETYSSGGKAGLEEELVAIAKSLNLDINKFKACLNSKESLQWYNADDKWVREVIIPAAAAAEVDGVGTPLFVICKSPKDNNTECEGKVLMGAYPFRYFKTIIDDLLQENK